MKAAVARFRQELVDLRAYIAALEAEVELMKLVAGGPFHGEAIFEPLETLVGMGSAKRRLNYCSVIIALYGSLEQLVEGLVRGYVGFANRIVTKHDDLPPAMQSNHSELTLALISKVDHSRFRGLISMAGLVSNLHSCLSKTEPYTLNIDAFSYHSANVRFGVIDSLFNRIGVQDVSIRCRGVSPFMEHLQSVFPGLAINGIKPVDLFRSIDDLAERRNEVAHGNAANILSLGILREYLEYVEAYGLALGQVVYWHSLAIEAPIRGIVLGNAIAVHNHNIVCLNLQNVGMKVGDTLVANTGDNERPVVGGEILEIEVNHAQVGSVLAQASVQVAARVSFRTKQNHDFTLLSAP
jgi:hypothetical protein